MSLVLFDNTVIGNKTENQKNIYDKVENATGLCFDKQYGYCTSTVEEERNANSILSKMGYKLRYFSGSFYPYLCKQ